MATTLPEIEREEKTSKPAATKYLFFFGGGKAEGDGKMKDVLGGKGAGLAEMLCARSKLCRGRSLAAATIRCWFRCARARSFPCRA
jgi:pyruvate,orthophosphate dikinase